MTGVTAASIEPEPLARTAHEPSWLLRPIVRHEGLRGQLLGGLAVLVVVALLAIACALLLWLPAAPSPGTLLLGLLGLVIADTAIVVLFGHYMMRKDFLDPVERMVEGAEAIADGELSRRLEEKGSRELQRLGSSVNRMAAKLIRNQELLAENVESLSETNRALTEARNELIHAEKLASVGRLAAGVAHEVGNPLSAILGYLDVAERQGARGAEWVREVRREVERLDRTVRGLLDFARPRSASSRVLDVPGLVDGAVKLLEGQGRLRGIDLQRELSAGLPEVRGDGHQLEQVLVNLLLNAVDAVEAAGGEGAIVIRTGTERYNGPSLADQPSRRADDPDGVDYSHLRRFRKSPVIRAPAFRRGTRIVRIDVVDEGVGLTEEEANQIFEPFFTTKDQSRGNGLGLAVSARLVEGMGGAIRAEPRPEGGACFSILLQAADSES